MSKEAKKKEATPELKSGATAHSDSNFEGQEHQSLRLGHQAKTAEPVKDAVENKSAHESARQNRFQINGEPNAAPRFENVE